MKEVKKINVLRIWPFDPLIYPEIVLCDAIGQDVENLH
jgi:hypothetical protein